MSGFMLELDDESKLSARLRGAVAENEPVELAPREVRLLLQHLDQEDHYKGAEGWVVVAVGERERACVVAVDPDFGALRHEIKVGGLSDPEEDLGLRPPCEPGLWHGRFRASATRCPETRVPDGLESPSSASGRSAAG